jgi:hypothetical protein
MNARYETPETIEAKAILRLVSIGTTTIDDARDLIAIPEKQERVLRAFISVAGNSAAPIHRAVNFRHKVAAEFEKLVSSFNQEAPKIN